MWLARLPRFRWPREAEVLHLCNQTVTGKLSLMSNFVIVRRAYSALAIADHLLPNYDRLHSLGSGGLVEVLLMTTQRHLNRSSVCRSRQVRWMKAPPLYQSSSPKTLPRIAQSTLNGISTPVHMAIHILSPLRMPTMTNSGNV